MNVKMIDFDKKNIIMMRGIPACGKSTWANDVINEYNGKIKRVNKDELRMMLDNSKWSRSNEKLIIKLRNVIIENTLSEGKSIIVDDTNISKKHEIYLREIARRYQATFYIKQIDLDLSECIARDKLRTNYVGEKVIRMMHKQLYKTEDRILLQNDKLDKAIICDIDGTIAIMKDRRPYDWDKVDTDGVNEPIRGLVETMSHTHKLIFMSGRDGICFDKTVKWIEDILPDVKFELFMRRHNDNRSDDIVKKELFFDNVHNKYYIDFVLDDRDKVVRLWRDDIGLTCLQVNYGDF